MIEIVSGIEFGLKISMDNNMGDSIERARNILKYGIILGWTSKQWFVNWVIKRIYILFIDLVAAKYPNNRELQELTKESLKKIETNPNILSTPIMKRSMFAAEKEISDKRARIEKDATQIQLMCEKFNDMFKNVREWKRNYRNVS